MLGTRVAIAYEVVLSPPYGGRQLIATRRKPVVSEETEKKKPPLVAC